MTLKVIGTGYPRTGTASLKLALEELDFGPCHHMREVIKTVPKERLLVFDARVGWGPLCEFLGVPVPKTPYPRVNTRGEMAALNAAAGSGESARPPSLEEIAKMARERFGR